MEPAAAAIMDAPIKGFAIRCLDPWPSSAPCRLAKTRVAQAFSRRNAVLLSRRQRRLAAFVSRRSVARASAAGPQRRAHAAHRDSGAAVEINGKPAAPRFKFGGLYLFSPVEPEEREYDLEPPLPPHHFNPDPGVTRRWQPSRPRSLSAHPAAAARIRRRAGAAFVRLAAARCARSDAAPHKTRAIRSMKARGGRGHPRALSRCRTAGSSASAAGNATPIPQRETPYQAGDAQALASVSAEPAER